VAQIRWEFSRKTLVMCAEEKCEWKASQSAKSYLGRHSRYCGHVVAGLQEQFTEMVETYAGQPGIEHLGILSTGTDTHRRMHRATHARTWREMIQIGVCIQLQQLLSINGWLTRAITLHAVNARLQQLSHVYAHNPYRTKRRATVRVAEIQRQQFPCSIIVWHPRGDFANVSRGNRSCRTRMLRSNCSRGISAILREPHRTLLL